MVTLDRRVKICVVTLCSAAVLAFYLYKRRLSRFHQYKLAIKKLLTESSPSSIVKISTVQYDVASKGVPFHVSSS